MKENEKKETKMQQYLAKLPAEIKAAANGALCFKEIVNTTPPKMWVKKHPFGNFDYIPIDKIELMLDVLFKKWEVEVLSYSIIANSIAVHIRLRVETYDGEVITHDGLGAAPIHTEKGASPVDHSKILTDSVMKALPAAKSFAIKDAAEHLGEIFGRNIGRKDTVGYVKIAGDIIDIIKNINV